MNKSVVVIRGGGDIGTGVAHRLHKSGFDVIVAEIENPLVIRRNVSFAQAVFEGQTVVEDVRAVKVSTREEIPTILKEGNIPVIVDPDCNIAGEIKAEVVVDATLAKKNTGMHKDLAPVTIALSPGFKAGEDVDAAIETNRGH
ncbi:MAG: molybdenum hydroxylase, partial [Deltaproteobacteria bacterium]|nr:molybdenum hydroxylase [Deltaproteobacteria bacterium]